MQHILLVSPPNHSINIHIDQSSIVKSSEECKYGGTGCPLSLEKLLWLLTITQGSCGLPLTLLKNCALCDFFMDQTFLKIYVRI